MAKRRQSPLDALIELIVYTIYAFLYLSFRLVAFLYDLVTFYTSQYKLKSGNDFFHTLMDKGFYGEFVLYRKLTKKLGKKAVLTNLYLDSKNTETTEIDVLAVTQKGIYVFEMKNYGGYIYGSQKDQYWTQAMNRFVKHKFYNPLRQNYAHMKAVESYLQVENKQILPIIVFSNRSKLSKINVGEQDKVYQFKDALKYVSKMEKKGNTVFSKDDVANHLEKLIEKSNMPDEVKQKHIEEIKQIQNQA
jgi:hypothetical protein